MPAGKTSCLATWIVLLYLMLAIALASCGSPASPDPQSGPGSATPADPDPAAANISTSDLVALVQSSLPEGAFKGVKALPLTVTVGKMQLWAVFSYGMRDHRTQPFPRHFVAIYARGKDGWQELSRQTLDDDTPAKTATISPDYVGDNDVKQVSLESTRIWIEAAGGAGAHSGTYQLLSFDGDKLGVELASSSSSPGFGRMEDIDGDGTAEAVLDQSDAYVFCYACGVRKIRFQVFAWDKRNDRMAEESLQPVPIGQQGSPAREVTNRAVGLANAGLWKEAMASIMLAKQSASLRSGPADNETLSWDYALIKLHADAMAKDVGRSPYPLLANIFFGD